MKKTVSWNGLIAMAAILAMSVLVFGCTDQQTLNEGSGSGSTKMTGSIAGLVVDINNNVVEGAKVTLRYPGGSATIPTGSDGGYLFSNVPVSGQLGCAEDCDENPYLIVVKSPGIRVDREIVYPYVTSYTAALLSFTSLQAISDANEWGGDWQAVSGMQVQAIPAVMRRPSAIVSGYVTSILGGEGLAGALVTLNPSNSAGPPGVKDIWRSGESSWAIGDQTTLSGAGGLFTFRNVPEGSDARMVEYVVTISAPGLQLCGEGHPGAMVGTGGHTYWVNSGVTVTLCPAIPPTDDVDPWVTQTNLPAMQIPGNRLDNTWCWQFNEVVDQDLGTVAVNFLDGAPVSLDPAGSGWDLTGEGLPPECPAPTTGNPVLFVTPTEPLPSPGATIVFELIDIADSQGNPYDGESPFMEPDAFTSLGTDQGATARGFTTGGDPTEMCVTEFLQVAALSQDPTTEPGGKSAVTPQANNQNDLNAGPYDTFTVDWNDAEACDASGEGQVMAYRVYAEYGTGGFFGGIPVLVGETVGDVFNPPLTGWTGTLTLVNAAIAAYSPDLPTLPETAYFDDGFALNMAATAVNAEDREGPYSNVALVMDNVPPTAVDQGEGFDTAGIDADDPTYLPFLTVDLDVSALPDPYVAADVAALSGDVDVTMSEDMDFPQLLASATTDSFATVASVNIVAADMRLVTVVLDNINLVAENDTLILNVTDEAENPSEVDAAVIMLDGVVPLIVGGSEEDPGVELQVTFSEEVENNAENPANYSVNGDAPDSAVLSLSGTVVTLTGTFTTGPLGIYEVQAGGVEDLAGNAAPANGFLIQGAPPDLTDPVISTAYHVAAPDVNSVDPAVADDGIWSVGDAITAPDTEVFVITIDVSEPMDPVVGIGASYAGGATCAMTDVDTTGGDQTADITITCTAGTVAAGDAITVNAEDLAGNPLGPDIILNAVGEGTNIDPITPAP